MSASDGGSAPGAGDGPASQVTKNCHYISRFLTRPWEGQQRKLHYFDFDTDTFDDGPSRHLFADAELNSQVVESWLDRYVEQPLGAARRRLAEGDAAALDDWRFFRAALLMLWLQGVRVKTIADDEARLELESLAAEPEAEIDALAAAVQEEFDLQLVLTVGDGDRFAALYFPSSGVFPLTYPDRGCLSGHAIGLGLPIHLNCALVATPTSRTGEPDLSRLSGSLSNLSVGAENARRVVIPPVVLESVPKDTLIENLKEMRRANDWLVNAVGAAREIVVDAFRVTGLAPAVDGGGRLRRPIS